MDVTCGTDGEVETYIYTTQHDNQTHLNVAIFGLVRAVGGVLSIVGGGVAAARLQHKLRNAAQMPASPMAGPKACRVSRNSARSSALLGCAIAWKWRLHNAVSVSTHNTHTTARIRT